MGRSLDGIGMDRPRLSAPVVILFALSLVLAVTAIVTVRVLSVSRPSVEQRFSIYLEKLAPQSMIVAATTQQRYTASKEFTAKLLAIFSIKAKIRLTALADVTYVISASDPADWSVSWDSRSRVFTMVTPAPDCLLPAVHTDTIEIYAENSNILTNMVFRLKEEAARMQSELSDDLLARAKATLQTPEVRKAIEDGLQKCAVGFCQAARLGVPAAVHVEMR